MDINVKVKRKINIRKLAIIIISILTILTIIVLLNVFLSKDFKIKSFDNTIIVNYKEEFVPDGGDICYGNSFDCEQVSSTIEADVDSSKLGDYTVTYIYKYKNKTKELKQTVKVMDNEPPELTISDNDIKACPNGKTAKLNMVATDNYDGDVTSSITQRIKDNKLILEVSDSNGNKTIVEKEISIEDEEPPQINLNGSSTKYLTVGSTYTDEGAIVTDNCDDEVELKIDNQVNTSTPGTYYVIYSATDQKGNTTTVKRTVYVYTQNNNPANQNNSAPGSKIIYLTFDDGPSAYTGKLLDILKKYNVKATFFVTGFGPDEMILREYQEGHTVALHTNTHNYSQVYASVDSYFADLNAIQNRVERITGHKSNLIRFPGGSSNAVSNTSMSYLTREVQNRGYHYFDWNVSSGDAGLTTSTDQVYYNVINTLKPSYSIVLQHDSKSYSVAAVERIIQYGLANGYTFLPLDETSPGAHHGTKN